MTGSAARGCERGNQGEACEALGDRRRIFGTNGLDQRLDTIEARLDALEGVR